MLISGAPISSDAVSGSGDRAVSGTGLLQAQDAAITGAGTGASVGVGYLQAQNAALVGTGRVQTIEFGGIAEHPRHLPQPPSFPVLHAHGILLARRSSLKGRGQVSGASNEEKLFLLTMV